MLSMRFLSRIHDKDTITPVRRHRDDQALVERDSLHTLDRILERNKVFFEFLSYSRYLSTRLSVNMHHLSCR